MRLRLLVLALLLAAVSASAGTIVIPPGTGDCSPYAVKSVNTGAAPGCLTASPTATNTPTPTATATPTATNTPTPTNTPIPLPLSLANGGTHADLSAAGGASFVLRQSSVGADITSSRLACADLSNSAASCSTDATNASNIGSGTLGLARGGTGSDLSATGGASQFLKQASVGGAVTVVRPACADLSNAAASCSTDTTVATNITSGTLPAGRLPNPSASTLGGIESYAAVSNQWINAISTSGVPSSTQPAAANLSDGTTGSGAIVLATSPTITTPTISTQSSAAGATEAFSATAPGQTASAQAGKGVTITSSDAVAGSSNAGAADGGGQTFTTGSAKRLSSGNGNGGDISFVYGSGIGTGRSGTVVFGGSTGTNHPIWENNDGGFILGLYEDGGGTGWVQFHGSTADIRFGTSGVWLKSTGQFAWSPGPNPETTPDLTILRAGAAKLQIGASAGVAQTITGDANSGTNVAGGSLTLVAGPGAGNGAGTKTSIGRNLMGASGTTAQTPADAYVACESKTLSNTSATTTALATLATTSNSNGGLDVVFTVTCTDGTNYDADTIRCTQSWKNHAGTLAFGTAQCTTTTGINDSGSCTIAPTFTGSGNTLNINVTPVISTIVPTTTTGMVTVTNNSTANVTCQ